MLEVKDKAAALKFTRVAQVLFVVAGGAAAAVAFVGGPKISSNPAEKYTPNVVAIQLPGERTVADMDLTGASARMGLIGNAPRPVPPPEDPKTEAQRPDEGVKAEATPTTNTGGGDVIQYLGPVRLGTKTLALLSIHGKQRFAALNDATDDGTLTEISSDHVTLTLRDVERKIDRAARGSEVVTRVSSVSAGKGGMLRPAAVAQPRPMQPTMPQPMVQPVQPMVKTDPSVQYDDIRSRLKQTGLYQSDEDLSVAAKQELERQIMGGKPPEKGPK